MEHSTHVDRDRAEGPEDKEPRTESFNSDLDSKPVLSQRAQHASLDGLQFFDTQSFQT